MSHSCVDSCEMVQLYHRLRNNIYIYAVKFINMAQCHIQQEIHYKIIFESNIYFAKVWCKSYITRQQIIGSEKTSYSWHVWKGGES